MPKEKALSEARKRANAKYDKENYQYITFKARKGTRDKIKAAAAGIGESLNGYIIKSIDERMERDGSAPIGES